MTFRTWLLLGAVVGSAALVASFGAPAATAAFSVTGDSLSLAQRDFRIFNNFTDEAANDNTQPHANFPGYTGAVMAIWKAHSEWGSVPRAGNGKGDPLASNPVLGDGGANFDNSFQGLSSSAGGTNDNLHCEILGSSGSTLSFVETPTSDGWRIQYFSTFNWSDGPGNSANGQLDLQGVATHEIGHVLGLGHSGVGGATMAPSISGTGESSRSIGPDDIAGIQAIYGVAAATKPRIDELAGSMSIGGTLVIRGINFAPVGNEIWFTKDAGDGEPLKVSGVASLGGTEIHVAIPAGVGDGDVLVKTGSTGAGLSNAFPLGVVDAPPVAGAFTAIVPGLGPVGPGSPPWMGGAGDLTPGSGNFLIQLEDAPPASAGLLFLSLSEGAVPLKGGTLYATPILATLPIAVNGAGDLLVEAVLPGSAPSGLQLVLQAWFAGGGPAGALASNGVRIDVP